VGTLRPNDLGLFDMHGNAWEWCQDPEATEPPRAPDASGDVVTDAHARIARGGAFGHGPLTLQSASQIPMQPAERGGDLGFRPARTLR
jgi:formylglycine-generating enzyme required for sulfatase activity